MLKDHERCAHEPLVSVGITRTHRALGICASMRKHPFFTTTRSPALSSMPRLPKLFTGGLIRATRYWPVSLRSFSEFPVRFQYRASLAAREATAIRNVAELTVSRRRPPTSAHRCVETKEWPRSAQLGRTYSIETISEKGRHSPPKDCSNEHCLS